MTNPLKFQQRVLGWFDQHGRRDLPWQRETSPYRVWVSEIMLQQTQVGTVIPYFERFMDALPTVQDLAQASEDQVLHLWTGLGYYSRARNLHRCAQAVCDTMGGEFPDTVETLCQLPGIGRSTAGAIRSIAFAKPAAILDGNVKRVLARYGAVAGWPGKSAVARQLWDMAEQLKPAERTADFSQAMMDLGATLCRRSNPHCEQCPLKNGCKARREGRQQDYPGKRPRKALPVRQTVMLVVTNPEGEVFLFRRPGKGLWGGLWSLPEVDSRTEAVNFCIDNFGRKPARVEEWDSLRHSFSHYHLDIRPLYMELPAGSGGVMEGSRHLWYNLSSPASVGLAAPVLKLLTQLAERP